jgi:hypothetical protein
MFTEKSVNRLVAHCYVAALGCAVVAGAFTWHAIDAPLGEAGLGLMGSLLAFLGALGMTLAYGAFLHLGIKGVAPVPAERRGGARAAIVAGTALLMLGSAYPNVIVTGGATAVGIEDRAYIATAAEVGDSLKAGVQAVLSIESVIDNGIAQLEVFERGETEGLTSGTPLAGQLASFARGRIAYLRQAKADLAPFKARVGEEMSRFDWATDKMRAALIAEGKTPAEKRVLMQRAGDECRSAAIAIGGAAPLIALESVADALMGPQIEPKWSPTADIRANQVEGFRKIKEELRRIGREIKQRTGDLTHAVKRTVPVYDPAPQSILVVKHWRALTNIYALFLALDGLPLVLFLVACAMYDGVRRSDGSGDGQNPSLSGSWPGAGGPGGATLGPHPHPRATAARAASLKAQKIEEEA